MNSGGYRSSRNLTNAEIRATDAHFGLELDIKASAVFNPPNRFPLFCNKQQQSPVAFRKEIKKPSPLDPDEYYS